MILLSLSVCEGVDENGITEILARRSNSQRQEIKVAFQQETGKVRLKSAHYLSHMISILHANISLLLFLLGFNEDIGFGFEVPLQARGPGPAHDSAAVRCT